MNKQEKSLKVIKDLIRGIENWADEKHEIHKDCFPAYSDAKKFLDEEINGTFFKVGEFNE